MAAIRSGVLPTDQAWGSTGHSPAVGVAWQAEGTVARERPEAAKEAVEAAADQMAAVGWRAVRARR